MPTASMTFTQLKREITAVQVRIGVWGGQPLGWMRLGRDSTRVAFQ